MPSISTATREVATPDGQRSSVQSVSGESPDLRTMLDQIESSADFFQARATANEQAGTLAPDVFARLLEIGAVHAMVPRHLGGAGFDAVAELRLIEALAKCDASTAWVTMATGFCTAAAAAYLADEAISAIFSVGHRGVVAGAGAPTGTARVVPGGFEVTGHWRYGSGVLFANWAHCGTFVEQNGGRLLDANGAPVMRICYIPMDLVAREDNWDVIGLRATGSVDFSADALFVPEAFTCLAGRPSNRRGGAIFNHSFTLATFVGHSGWAVGAGQHLLDELAAHARSTGKRPGSLADNGAFHEQFAAHQIALLSARAFVYDCWERTQECCDAGRDVDMQLLTLIRLALVNVTNVAAEIAAYAFRAGGGESLRAGPLQRLCRDIQAGCQHATSSSSVTQACGRVLTGLAENEAWATNGLVKRGPANSVQP